MPTFDSPASDGSPRVMHRMYCEDGLPLEILARKAPLIARAVLKQRERAAAEQTASDGASRSTQDKALDP